MDDRGLDQWAAIEAAFDERVHLSATVMLASRFSEMARVEALKAEGDLQRAVTRAERARSYLDRTTNTLEQAIRLHAMGRE